MRHKPVLKKEVLKYLNPRSNQNFIDCTVGEGGHALAILEINGPEGRVLGIDWDEEQIRNSRLAEKSFKERLVLVNDSYRNLKDIVEREKFRPVSGILLDLGMSSWHLEDSGRGFSFLKDEPLDMRYRCRDYLTAEEVVNEYSQEKLERIIKEYGEERFYRKIAKRIIEARKIKRIKTTFQLVEIIGESVPARGGMKIHPATRTFQALRIAVNSELDNLEIILPQAVEILEPGGRIIIISFHSLEDRIVKNFFKDSSSQLEIITKKPITADSEEIISNSRSRSAKLRAAVKRS